MSVFYLLRWKHYNIKILLFKAHTFSFLDTLSYEVQISFKIEGSNPICFPEIQGN